MSGPNDSLKTYIIVFVILMLLLVASVVAAQWQLGPWNAVVALGISAAKALLVMLYFMHLLESPQLVRVVAISGFVWLAFLIVLAMSDYETRAWDDARQSLNRPSLLNRF